MNQLTAPLYIVVTVDCDPDDFDESVRGERKGSEPSWNGMQRGSPIILETLQRLRDVDGKPARVTWFVRADNQIKRIYGDSAFLFSEYSELWKTCAELRHELGWHPHLYRFENQSWVQERDELRLTQILREIHGDLRARGLRFSSSRIGDAYGSNAVLATLDELGISCDSSALPGRSRSDSQRNFDWTQTPQLPYFPARSNYRASGTPCLNLLQVPMTMIPTQASYDPAPLLRYVDLTFHRRALQEGISAAIRNLPLLVTIMHPSSLLPNVGRPEHALLSFDPTAFKNNVDLIMKECTESGREFRFITMNEVRTHFGKRTDA